MEKEKIIQGIEEYTKKIFFKLKNRLAPMVFFIKDDKAAEIAVIDFKNDMQRIDVFQKVGIMAKQKDYKVVVIVSETSMKTISGMSIKDVLDNFDTERPSTYPENMRQDGLMLSYVDLVQEKVELHFSEYENNTKQAFKESKRAGEGKISINSVAAIVMEGYKIIGE